MQRVGWAGMAIMVVLASAGAFGDGPLSSNTVTTADGSTIAFSRVMRAEMPELVRMQGGSGSTVQSIRVDSGTLRWLTIESTVPRADREVRARGMLEFVLTTGAGGDVEMELVVIPRTIGWHRLRARFGEAPWTDVGVLVLP